MGLHGQNKCHQCGLTFGCNVCVMRAEIHTKAFSPGQGFIDTNAVTGIDSL
jgi:hypothetical protein